MKKILIFSLTSIALGILAGCSSSTSIIDSGKIITTAFIINTGKSNTEYETIQVGYNGINLTPEVINLTVGKNYKLIITPTSDGTGAMTTMTIPSIDEHIYDIRKGQAITIMIRNAQAGRYAAVCSKYRMFQGMIIIQ